MNHSLNLTHDGTLIVRVPKGYKVEKVKVETFEGEEIPTHTTPSNTLDALDCISRQAAIDVLHGYLDGMLETDTVCPQDLYNLFEIIPSVQPRKGKWIERDSNGVWECDQCKKYSMIYKANFCPNCGADMRGEQDDH